MLIYSGTDIARPSALTTNLTSGAMIVGWLISAHSTVHLVIFSSLNAELGTLTDFRNMCPMLQIIESAGMAVLSPQMWNQSQWNNHYIYIYVDGHDIQTIQWKYYEAHLCQTYTSTVPHRISLAHISYCFSDSNIECLCSV